MRTAPVKILHLLGDPADLGGIFSVIRCLHEISSPSGDRHVALVHAGFQETRRPALEYRFSRHLRAESSNHPRLLFGAVPALVELRRLLRTESFDLIHAHTRGALPVAMLLTALFRRTVVCTHHTYARRTWLYRCAASLAHLHTVVLTPNMARHYGFAPGSPRLSIISACCAERFFESPLDPVHPARPASQPLRLLGVGNIVRWKKWHLMLDALASLAPAERRLLHFTHCGEAPRDPDSTAYAQSLRDRIQRDQLDSCISFLGPVFDIPRRLREADWFVIPSTNEPCSVALIEALAQGKPALVSASGGNVDIVSHDRTGLLFTPDDPGDLSLKLRQLLSGKLSLATPPEIRRSVDGRRAAEVTRLYQELYNRLLSPDRAIRRSAVKPMP
jgi:glycosyltransferase involved in cell wall biosynthesis